jgi:hypothetical protein
MCNVWDQRLYKTFRVPVLRCEDESDIDGCFHPSSMQGDIVSLLDDDDDVEMDEAGSRRTKGKRVKLGSNLPSGLMFQTLFNREIY